MREGIYFNVYDAVRVTCMVSPTVYNWVLFTIFVQKLQSWIACVPVYKITLDTSK